MAGKRGETVGGAGRGGRRRSGGGPVCTARKKENQQDPWSDRNSNRSRTIQMTVRVRSRGRRRAQSAAIYFCLPTLHPSHFARPRPLIFTPREKKKGTKENANLPAQMSCKVLFAMPEAVDNC